MSVIIRPEWTSEMPITGAYMHKTLLRAVLKTKNDPHFHFYRAIHPLTWVCGHAIMQSFAHVTISTSFHKALS